METSTSVVRPKHYHMYYFDWVLDAEARKDWAAQGCKYDHGVGAEKVLDDVRAFGFDLELLSCQPGYKFEKNAEGRYVEVVYLRIRVRTSTPQVVVSRQIQSHLEKVGEPSALEMLSDANTLGLDDFGFKADHDFATFQRLTGDPVHGMLPPVLYVARLFDDDEIVDSKIVTRWPRGVVVARVDHLNPLHGVESYEQLQAIYSDAARLAPGPRLVDALCPGPSLVGEVGLKVVAYHLWPVDYYVHGRAMTLAMNWDTKGLTSHRFIPLGAHLSECGALLDATRYVYRDYGKGLVLRDGSNRRVVACRAGRQALFGNSAESELVAAPVNQAWFPLA